jgi:hypothetical protein
MTSGDGVLDNLLDRLVVVGAEISAGCGVADACLACEPRLHPLNISYYTPLTYCQKVDSRSY